MQTRLREASELAEAFRDVYDRDNRAYILAVARALKDVDKQEAAPTPTLKLRLVVSDVVSAGNRRLVCD